MFTLNPILIRGFSLAFCFWVCMVDELNSLMCGRCTYTYWWDNIQSSTFWPYSLGHWLSWSHSNRVLCSWSKSKICQQALLEQPPEVGNIGNLRRWFWWGWSSDYATLHILPSLHELVKHLQYLPTWVPKRGVNRTGPFLNIGGILLESFVCKLWVIFWCFYP